MTQPYEAKHATTYSIHNRTAIDSDTKCGCYFCLRVCKGSEITEWVDEEKDTAICPHCGIDSLLPNKNESEFLAEANVIFFTGKTK